MISISCFSCKRSGISPTEYKIIQDITQKETMLKNISINNCAWTLIQPFLSEGVGDIYLNFCLDELDSIKKLNKNTLLLVFNNCHGVTIQKIEWIDKNISSEEKNKIKANSCKEIYMYFSDSLHLIQMNNILTKSANNCGASIAHN